MKEELRQAVVGQIGLTTQFLFFRRTRTQYDFDRFATFKLCKSSRYQDNSNSGPIVRRDRKAFLCLQDGNFETARRDNIPREKSAAICACLSAETCPDTGVPAKVHQALLIWRQHVHRLAPVWLSKPISNCVEDATRVGIQTASHGRSSVGLKGMAHKGPTPNCQITAQVHRNRSMPTQSNDLDNSF